MPELVLGRGIALTERKRRRPAKREKLNNIATERKELNQELKGRKEETKEARPVGEGKVGKYGRSWAFVQYI